MKVLIFEDNLIWSQRLLRSAKSLGYEAVALSPSSSSIPEGDVAIVNLGTGNPEELVPKLKAVGIRVVAHAGHKEKELRALGERLGCDRLASNSELTFKLAEILELLAGNT